MWRRVSREVPNVWRALLLPSSYYTQIVAPTYKTTRRHIQEENLTKLSSADPPNPMSCGTCSRKNRKNLQPQLNIFCDKCKRNHVKFRQACLRRVTRIRSVLQSRFWWLWSVTPLAAAETSDAAPCRQKSVLTYELGTLSARVHTNRVLSLARGRKLLIGLICHPVELCSWSLPPVEIDDYIL